MCVTVTVKLPRKSSCVCCNEKNDGKQCFTVKRINYDVFYVTQERKELERRVDEEIQKQESLISVAGVDSRAKRRCVIMREQMSKKKEWWEEEGLGSESEEDNERELGKKKNCT